MYIVISKKRSSSRMWKPAAASAVFWGSWSSSVPHNICRRRSNHLRTDGPSFPLSFTVLWGALALRLFLSPFVGSLGCFPRSKKEGRGSEKRKLMLSAREPGRIYLERKREDLVRATSRHGSPWTCLQPLGFPSAIWTRVRVIRRR